MLSMVLYFFAGLLPLGLITLLFGIELRFFLTAEFGQLRLRVVARLLGGVLKYRFELIAAGMPPTVYFNGRGIGRQKKRAKRRKKRGIGDYVHVISRGVRIEKLKIYGSAGVRGDACAGVLITGALNALFCELAMLSHAPSICVWFVPALDCDVLCINLEGIAHINAVKTMSAALSRRITKKREGRRKDDAPC